MTPTLKNVLCYTNNIPQKDGGTHLSGFRSSLTRVMKSFIKKEELNKKNPVELLGEDVRELNSSGFCKFQTLSFHLRPKKN